jgi:hypothetical protein
MHSSHTLLSCTLLTHTSSHTLRNLWTTNGENQATKNLKLSDVIRVLQDEEEQGWLGVDEFTALREEFHRDPAYEHVCAYQVSELRAPRSTAIGLFLCVPLSAKRSMD